MADVLRAYAARGIGHVQLVIDPITRGVDRGLRTGAAAAGWLTGRAGTYVGSTRCRRDSPRESPGHGQDPVSRAGADRVRACSSLAAVRRRRVRERATRAPSPSAAPTPLVDARTRTSPSPATAQQVFAASGKAGLRITANTATPAPRTATSSRGSTRRTSAGRSTSPSTASARPSTEGDRLESRRGSRPGRAAGRDRRHQHPDHLGPDAIRRACRGKPDDRQMDGLTRSRRGRSTSCSRRSRHDQRPGGVAAVDAGAGAVSSPDAD